MKRSFMALFADKYIRRVHRITKKSVVKNLANFKKNKDNYIIPKLISFPRKIECKLYNNMQVFEMPCSEVNNKIIMYIHGGGYLYNFSTYHWKFLSDMAKNGGYGFTAANYPLLPRYTYKDSHQKIIEYYKEYSTKHNMKDVVIAGDSAGGGFVLALLEQIKELNLPLPGKAILISPFVDATKVSKKLSDKDSLVDCEAALMLGKAWANGDDLMLPQISPLYGNLTGLPPIDIYVGTYDILFDQCVEVYEKLKECGNNVRLHIGEEMGHVYPLYPIPEGKKARRIMIEFIEK